jgi:hypothetical protein
MGLSLSSIVRWSAAAVAVGAAGYAGTAACTWLRYGHPGSPGEAERDPLLDRFMPLYEVVERHSISIGAPSGVTYAAAREQDLLQSPVVRAIFRTREIVLGAAPDGGGRPHQLLPQVLSLGWGVLAEAPGREIVIGAVTRPWEANVTFRAVPPEAFAAFAEPGYVKIVWTLRADPLGPEASVFRTETRVQTTDPRARTLFRRYWAAFSPGIWLIRRLSLGPLKREAERRARREPGFVAGRSPAGRR